MTNEQARLGRQVQQLADGAVQIVGIASREVAAGRPESGFDSRIASQSNRPSNPMERMLHDGETSFNSRRVPGVRIGVISSRQG